MFEWINRNIFGVAVPIFLIAIGVYFGCSLGWFHLLHPIKTLRAAFSGNARSAFSSLCLALAGTLGVGNIVGVSGAIAMGGYGAVFWMCLSAFFAMTVKFAETVLAEKHRRDSGGSAMRYIEDSFSRLGLKRVGGVLGILFALFLAVNALTMGSMIQTGAVADAFFAAFSIPKYVTSAIVAIVALIIVVGGKYGIMKVTERIVPFMTVAFVIMSVWALAVRWQKIPEALFLIFKDAFSLDAAAGGAFGFLFSRALRFGVMRGLVSNEAGCGTSPMAHTASKGEVPSVRGIWGIFEVFVDTILLCTLTALVIIVSGVSLDTNDFMWVTMSAYTSILGEWAEGVMSVAVMFFGFATVICWWHYGTVGVDFLWEKKWAKILFGVLYTLSIVLGGIVSPSFAWQAADMSIGVMTLINLFVLFISRKEINETKNSLFSY